MKLILVRKNGHWDNVFSVTLADKAAQYAAETGGELHVVEVPLMQADKVTPAKIVTRKGKRGKHEQR